MKKFMYTAFAVCFAFMFNASNFINAANPGDTLTLNISSVLNPVGGFTFNSDSVWTETYNDTAYTMIDFEHFSLSHLISGNSYGGIAWDGFTVSKNHSTTDPGEGRYSFPWGNMAGGGIKTDANGKVLKNEKGRILADTSAPYFVAYWGEYTDYIAEMPSLHIIFTDGNPCEPTGIYLNSSPVTFYGLINGDGIARAFNEEGDSLNVVIHGLDENYEDNEGATVKYTIAAYRDGYLIQNKDWRYVDLSGLGLVYGLYFTMESPDMSYGMVNTSTYFCMDKLQVKMAVSTGNSPVAKARNIRNVRVYPNPFVDYITVNTESAGKAIIYDLMGKAVLTVDVSAGENTIKTSALGEGIYLFRLGGETVKIVK